MLSKPLVIAAIVSAPAARDLRELLRAANTLLSPDETGALANVATVQDPRMELRHV